MLIMKKFQNRGITNESEVTTFGASIFKIMEADPGYFNGVTNKQELQNALEDYFNANGLVAVFNQEFLKFLVGKLFCGWNLKFRLAPPVGFEPTTQRLTAACSTD